MIAIKIMFMVVVTCFVIVAVCWSVFWIARLAYRTFTGWEQDKEELLELYEAVKTKRKEY